EDPRFVQGPPTRPSIDEAPGENASLTPTFRFHSVVSDFGAEPELLQYRVELSRPSAGAGSPVTTEVYDQRSSHDGWSKPSYASGEVAQFVPTAPLLAGTEYSWTVQAFAWRAGGWAGEVSSTQHFTTASQGTSTLTTITFEEFAAPRLLGTQAVGEYEAKGVRFGNDSGTTNATTAISKEGAQC